ncbi:MAG: S46 family peptidase [Acidobacteriota bacterium]|nr:S46 family peptidase [Acidobacteriota bacterium]
MRSIALILLSFPLLADEGMWLFNRVPAARLKESYGFEITPGFLDHLRLASVRMGGGSTSFVSPHGLLFTNHHVALECLQKISTAGQNYVSGGFIAKSKRRELRCPDFEANVLLKIDEVTERVKSVMHARPGTPEANQQRKAALSQIEKDCTAKTGNKCSVATLYDGAVYDLYEYKRYTDIRLVFAPESEIGFFGGDPDNFTYPRFDLDIAFFRAYENGKPPHTPEYLKWSREGVKDGELTFVSGNPGHTDRLDTVAGLAFQRDVRYPFMLNRLKNTVDALESFGAKNPEAARMAHDDLFSAQNGFKAYAGEYQGLQDPKLMDLKRRQETELRDAVAADPKMRGKYGSAWDDVAAAMQTESGFYKRMSLLEGGPYLSQLFSIARNVYRMPAERAKPNGQRLREYTDAARESLELRVFSPAPVSDGLEIALLANYFRELQDELGASNPVIQAVLSGNSPRQAAFNDVANSKLKDVGERRRLAASVEAIQGSKDPMIQLMRVLDGPAREYRKMLEDEVEAVKTNSSAKIAQASFAVHGNDQYPDATFTLRLSYGPVKGYMEDGKAIPWSTDFAGMYAHATGAPPYRLPDRWLKAKFSLDPGTALDFVTTADITGGNSGSPTVNTKGEIVGIVFDGNIQELPNNFLYGETQARAVHVASQGIVEALRKVYHADNLLKEIGMK